jgi:tRNA modification GTPase
VATIAAAGPLAVEATATYFRPAGDHSFADAPVDRILYGIWQSAHRAEDVVVCRRELQLVEIHCHGGKMAAQEILHDLQSRDIHIVSWRDWVVRRAECPLTAQAELALTSASTERTARILLDQYHGALRRHITTICESLTKSEGVESAIRALDELLETSRCGLHLTKPWQVALVGPPNVGKSSLINALVGYQRSLVYDQPGTTRDSVSAITSVDGWPVEFTDTAGLRETCEPIEAAGIQRTQMKMSQADLLIIVTDGEHAASHAIHELRDSFPTALLVLNKVDLPCLSPEAVAADARTSALTGAGIDALLALVAQKLVPIDPRPGQALLFSPLQIESVQRARSALIQGDPPSALVELTALLNHPGRFNSA